MKFPVVGCFMIASSLGAFAQGGAATAARTIQLAPSRPDPVKIVKVMLDGVEVKTGL